MGNLRRLHVSQSVGVAPDQAFGDMGWMPMTQFRQLRSGPASNSNGRLPVTSTGRPIQASSAPSASSTGAPKAPSMNIARRQPLSRATLRAASAGPSAIKSGNVGRGFPKLGDKVCKRRTMVAGQRHHRTRPFTALSCSVNSPQSPDPLPDADQETAQARRRKALPLEQPCRATTSAPQAFPRAKAEAGDPPVK